MTVKIYQYAKVKTSNMANNLWFLFKEDRIWVARNQYIILGSGILNQNTSKSGGQPKSSQED